MGSRIAPETACAPGKSLQRRACTRSTLMVALLMELCRCFATVCWLGWSGRVFELAPLCLAYFGMRCGVVTLLAVWCLCRASAIWLQTPSTGYVCSGPRVGQPCCNATACVMPWVLCADMWFPVVFRSHSHAPTTTACHDCHAQGQEVWRRAPAAPQGWSSHHRRHHSCHGCCEGHGLHGQHSVRWRLPSCPRAARGPPTTPSTSHYS